MEIHNFLNNELVQFAKYSTLRAIPSVIDGLKNSSRKVIFTAQKDLKSETKVNIFAGNTQTKTEYLHGDISGSIINLAKDYCGSNNLPLLKPCGNFGTRFFNENSAIRYIFTEKQPYFNKVFNDLDNSILIKQHFEGTEIEPRFFVPTIPLILINGSKGVATGFASEILNRKTENVIKYILNHLQGKKNNKSLLNVYYEKFNGNITQENNKVFIEGLFEIKKNNIVINEIPIGYDLTSYKKHLDNLEEKKIIKSYEDNSNDDIFNFTIKVDKTFIEKGKEYITKTLGLIKTFSENYTCLDENNKIIEFNNVEEIINYFINIKLQFTERRRQYLIKTKELIIEELESICKFIESILYEEINLKKQNKEEIIPYLEKNNFFKKDDSFDYLFKIPILHFTPSRLQLLKNKMTLEIKELMNLQQTTAKDMWIEDLNNLIK